jgi:hypothetical protein
VGKIASEEEKSNRLPHQCGGEWSVASVSAFGNKSGIKAFCAHNGCAIGKRKESLPFDQK